MRTRLVFCKKVEKAVGCELSTCCTCLRLAWHKCEVYVYYLGNISEESSPVFPKLSSMDESDDVELPKGPVLRSAMSSNEDEEPEMPEFTTINLRVCFLFSFIYIISDL